jgi:hypothetical protein
MRHVGDKVKTGLTLVKKKSHSPQWNDTFVLYVCVVCCVVCRIIQLIDAIVVYCVSPAVEEGDLLVIECWNKQPSGEGLPLLYL